MPTAEQYREAVEESRVAALRKRSPISECSCSTSPNLMSAWPRASRDGFQAGPHRAEGYETPLHAALIEGRPVSRVETGSVSTCARWRIPVVVGYAAARFSRLRPQCLHLVSRFVRREQE